MTQMTNFDLKPQILISETDHRQLVTLGGGDSADALLAEIERAQVVPEASLPAAVVRMGSRVTYRPDNGAERAVTLVYPADADIATGKISVLTPIGTALIGLSAGQSISWEARDGREHVLTVLTVEHA